ncbi:MAG: IS110 family transposase [Candidatus Kryptoniota bacterium]
MQKQGKQLDFTGQQVYVGIDVGKKSWEVSIMTKDFEHKTFRQSPDVEGLIRYLRKNFPGGEYKSVYEAGFSGYSTHERLSREGVDSIVVNPGDVPTKETERARKNNIIDARKLARSLRSGEIHGIYVPSRETQEDRSLVRMRQTLVRKQTRVKNQIKSFLLFYGIKLPEDIGEKYWSRRFIGWVEELANREGAGSYALKVLIEELKNLRRMILEITRKIRDLSEEDRYAGDVINIVSVPGFSTVSAMMILTEIMDICRFKKLDEFRSYLGIVPGEHSTGEDETTTGLTRIRNKVLRTVLIEASWVAVRKDPALMLAFTELSKRMKKNEAIIRIAKKMVNRLWYVLKNKNPYQIGVVE